MSQTTAQMEVTSSGGYRSERSIPKTHAASILSSSPFPSTLIGVSSPLIPTPITHQRPDTPMRKQGHGRGWKRDSLEKRLGTSSNPRSFLQTSACRPTSAFLDTSIIERRMTIARPIQIFDGTCAETRCLKRKVSMPAIGFRFERQHCIPKDMLLIDWSLDRSGKTQGSLDAATIPAAILEPHDRTGSGRTYSVQ